MRRDEIVRRVQQLLDAIDDEVPPNMINAGLAGAMAEAEEIIHALGSDEPKEEGPNAA